MKNTILRFAKLSCGIAVGLMVSQGQLALAGWTGTMNGSGYGQASVNVRAFETSLAKKRTATTTNMVSPSASIAPTTGYATNAPLPVDASPATVARVKGLPGYIWQAETVGSDGDSTDNDELESRVRITAADCASAQMTSSAVIAPDDKSGRISMNINATAGTAVWTRGFEFTGDPSLLPSDDPDTEGNETIEFLKTNVLSSLKWDVLLVGPLSLNETNCNAVTIPFTVETSVSNNLYYVTDAVAKSLPLVIECPPAILATDQQSVTYPSTVLVGGCGEITVSFSGPPPAGGSFPPNSVFPPGSFPVGTTPVTVTAADTNGNTKTCTFNVVVSDTTAPVIRASGTPDNGVLGLNPTEGQIEDALGTATATDNGGDVTPTAATGSVSVNGCSRSQTRTWNATDAAGNAAAPVTRTATWTEDTTPPVVPSLSPVTGSCSTPVTLTAPTTTDNCAGTVTGTTTTSFPITALGTTVVTWTFNDGNGNRSTADQTVILSGNFNGFYSPIGGTGGSCTAPLRTAKLGNNLPVKFDVSCNGSPVTTGTPTLSLQQCSGGNYAGGGNFQLVGNEWHFNWDTTGRTVGVYELTATLQDGSTRTVFIRLK